MTPAVKGQEKEVPVDVVVPDVPLVVTTFIPGAPSCIVWSP